MMLLGFAMVSFLMPAEFVGYICWNSCTVQLLRRGYTSFTGVLMWNFDKDDDLEGGIITCTVH